MVALLEPLEAPVHTIEALRRIAFLLERTRAGTYRVEAFRNAARTLRTVGADELDERVEAGTLQEIPGIGKSTAGVVEEAVRGFTLRHLANNRVCRLSLMLRDKRVVSLPKTDARLGLAGVERVAGLVRDRLGVADSRQGTHRPQALTTLAPSTLAPDTLPRAAPERDMMRELIRLRLQQADAQTARRAERAMP